MRKESSSLDVTDEAQRPTFAPPPFSNVCFSVLNVYSTRTEGVQYVYMMGLVILEYHALSVVLCLGSLTDRHGMVVLYFGSCGEEMRGG